jgi:antitoxin ParD1/3/4
MNVSLTPELERFIGGLVESGRYRSASEVVRAAVRLLEDREREREVKLEALRNAVGEGLEELERGDAVPGD